MILHRNKRLLLSLSLLIVAGTSVTAQQPVRTLRGRVYFTNNTPDDRPNFPIELLSSDGKRVIKSTTQGTGDFHFDDIRPGKYLVRLKWPGQCTLTYSADVRKTSISNARILMDVDCAHNNGKIKPLPSN